MTRLIALLVLMFGLSANALGDVWKYVDDQGRTHFVDSDRPIYTWRDKFGKSHYADKPGSTDAVMVQLTWVSAGTLEEVKASHEAKKDSSLSGFARPGETADERTEREAAEAYYCKRAKEILESYHNAPALYKTGVDGEQVVLSDAEMAATIADAQTRTAELCGE